MRVTNDVLAVLSNCRAEQNKLFLTDNLPRSMYLSVNTVLDAAGGKWNRSAKAHLFPGDAADAIEQIILTGEVTIPQDFGYFPSPPDVVARILELAEINRRHRVFEPSAGRGAIALAVAQLGAQVDCVELLPANYEHLLTLHGTNALNGQVICGDFLALKPAPIYDRITMNPPFAKQADIIHVQHALKFLKPIGLLVSIMAAGVMFRENRLTTEFRKLVDQRGGEIELLPEGSFKQSGTGVNTVVVTIPGG